MPRSAALCCAAKLLHDAPGRGARRGDAARDATSPAPPDGALDGAPVRPAVVTVELGCHPTLTSYASKVLTREGVQVLAQGAAMRRGHATADFITRERTRLEALLLR